MEFVRIGRFEGDPDSRPAVGARYGKYLVVQGALMGIHLADVHSAIVDGRTPDTQCADAKTLR
jgi:hypothetical protein